MRLALLPLPLALLLACPGPKGEDSGDTGDTGEVVVEDGCITVDGAGGYGQINDAIMLATEGAVVQLCAGTYEEAVVIDKGVTLVGGDGVLISAPSNEVAISITAANVTVQDVEIESTRAGVVATGATGLVLSGVDIGETGSWSLTLDGSDATVTASTFTGTLAGAVEVVGGTATFEDCAVSGAAGYGFSISDGADVTIAGTTITGVTSSGDDGNALYVIESSLTTDGNTIDTPGLAGIWAEDATLDLVGDTIVDPLYAVLAQPAELSASGLTITGAVYQGIYGFTATGQMSVADTSISIDAGASCSLSYKEWVDYLICGGILFAADDIALSNVAISGYENYGVTILPYNDTAGIAFDGVTITDVGRTGFYLSEAEGTISDTTVSELREPEVAEEEQCYYVQYSAAILNYGGDLTMDAVTLSGNDGWGLTNLEGSATLTGGTIADNSCAGVINYNGVFTADTTAFSGGALHGALVDYGAVTTVTNSTFDACMLDEYWYSYEYDGVEYTNVQYGYGTDIQANDTSQLTVIGNTFTNGEDSILVYGGTAEISGNTWSGYDGNVMVFSGDGSGDGGVVSANTVDDVGGSVVYAYSSEVEVEDLVVGTTRSSEYGYAYYVDGVLQYEGSYTSYSSVFSAGGSGTDASLSLTNVSVDSAYYSVLQANDAQIDVDGLSVAAYGGETSAYGLYLYAYYTGIDVELKDVTLPDDGYMGIYHYDYYGYGGTLVMDGVSIGDTSGYGLYTMGLTEITATDVDFGFASSGGVYARAIYSSSSGSLVDAATNITLDRVTLEGSYGDGISVSGGALTATELTVADTSGSSVSAMAASRVSIAGGTLSGGSEGVSVVDSESFYDSSLGSYVEVDADTVTTLTGVTITDASSTGAVLWGGSASVSGCTITGSGGSALELSGVTAEVSGNDFTSNAQYGMVCDDTTLGTCATNDLTQNGAGTHDGCDDACGI